MSLMERRLQLLLDEQRYTRVAEEAARSGRSVAAVIREAIDVRFGVDLDVRADAGRRLLAMSEHPLGHEPEWDESKRHLERALDEKLS